MQVLGFQKKLGLMAIGGFLCLAMLASLLIAFYDLQGCSGSILCTPEPTGRLGFDSPVMSECWGGGLL